MSNYMSSIITKLVEDITHIAEMIEQTATELDGAPSISACEAVLSLRDAQAALNRAKGLFALAVCQARDTVRD